MTSGLVTYSSPPNLLTRTPPHMLHEPLEMSPNPSSPALSTSSNGGTPKKSEPPKRLRYWLIDMIDSGEIPGLRWEDGSRTVFRIPWKHAGKNNWKEEDCKIFQAWAVHRGKYKKGDKVDPATWKTRLRCALNKLGDIKELKERSNLEGNDPFRVYKLLPEQDRAQEPEIYPRESWPRESVNQIGSREVSDYVTYHHQQNIQMMSSTTLDTSPREKHFAANQPVLGHDGYHDQNIMRQDYNDMNMKYQGAPAGGFANQPKRNMYASPYGQNQGSNQPQPMMDRSVNQMGYNNTSTNYKMETEGFDMGGYQNGMVQEMHQPQFSERAPSPWEMDIFIYYRGKVVIHDIVTVPTGCRLHYGDTDLQLIAKQTHQLPSGVFGSDSLHQIGFPECESFSISQKQVCLTRHVLDNMKRGLVLFYEDGCFYTRRLCQSRVFILGPETTGDAPEKLEREEKVKVFDYKKFHSHLEQYFKGGKSKKPEIELKASFGQNWSIKTPFEKNLVTFMMMPRAAHYYLSKISQQNEVFESYNSLVEDMSVMPNSNDFLAERATTHLDRLLDEVLTNLYPNLIRPFSDSPASHPPVPASQPHVPTTSTHSNSTFGHNELFQRNVIPIAPISPVNMNDVEMGGMM